ISKNIAHEIAAWWLGGEPPSRLERTSGKDPAISCAVAQAHPFPRSCKEHGVLPHDVATPDHREANIAFTTRLCARRLRFFASHGLAGAATTSSGSIAQRERGTR